MYFILQCGSHIFREEVRGLLLCSARVFLWLQDALELLERYAERFVRCDSLQKVVLAAFFLDDLGRRHGMDTDSLVKLLTVCSSLLHGVHHNVLGRHEGQLLAESLLDDLGINDKPVRDVRAERQHAVNSEERFGYAETLVRGVVKRTLEPLGRGGEVAVENVYHHISGKGADTLAAHRVTLIRHC